MPTAKPAAARRLTTADSTEAVDRLMGTLEHPHKDAIAALRTIVCSADPGISEGVKWNSPSYRTHEYFATTHLRAKSGTGLILHLGAKVRDIESLEIADPEHLLTWLAKDRALLAVADLAEAKKRKAAIVAVLKQWILYV
jgi:hypothetical protein